MQGPSDLTLSLGGHRRDLERGPTQQPVLVVAMECDRLASGSTRHALGGVSAVLLGRGRERTAERRSGPGGHELVLQVPDRWMSSQHARIEASFGRWILSDAGSKNGTVVAGVATERAVLRDGDLIELGHTLLLFRERVPLWPDDPVDLSIDLAALGARPPGLVTLSPAYQRVLAELERMAASTIPILLLGESGTGKELLARAVHQISGRRGELIAVNCGAIPDTLVESELFGHKKGAFSGASEDRLGLVRGADGGTLFLDEVGDLPLASQAALLRVLQEREVLPVGGSRPVPVDIRVVAATHRDLPAMVASGEFRQDLYARLTGYTVALPALRDRREDIGLLCAALLARHGGGDLSAHPGIDAAAARALLTHGWPRNVRELDSCLAAATVLAGDGPIEIEHLPQEVREGPREAEGGAGAEPAPGGEPGAAVPGAEEPGRELSDEDRRVRDELVAHLTEHAGNISAVARAMGKDRKQIQRWVKRFGIDPGRYR
ncbi:MAG TPA: sigma 54-interacting transcriptional regulator [Kofleriaceae bacterium]|nr:sigma 54-interacting transcriptional regulator [Kofleriaceae bacterium]